MNRLPRGSERVFVVEVAALLREIKPTLVLFDNAGRSSQLRAAVAVAHKILVSVWHMLRNGTFYQELGAGFPDLLDRERTARHQGHRLANMGFDVQKAA